MEKIETVFDALSPSQRTQNKYVDSKASQHVERIKQSKSKPTRMNLTSVIVKKDKIKDFINETIKKDSHKTRK